MPKAATTEISIIEAAKQLDVEPSYVYLLARAGRLGARKDGRLWLVSAKAVKERLERLGASSK
jgi:excisionase family DNA binding protein